MTWPGRNEPEVTITGRAAIEEVLPLAPLQEGLLFHAELDEAQAGVYVVQMLVDLEGHLEPDRLEVAARALVDRHASLRVAFRRRRSGEAIQVVTSGVIPPWRRVVADAATVADEERRRPLDRKSVV